MGYREWIERERRVRGRLLKDIPLADGKRRIRICRECGEFCLCYEERCPNCDSSNIVPQNLIPVAVETVDENQIRCRFRYEHLDAAAGGEKTSVTERLRSGLGGGKA
jgi:hypothetical protein